MKYSDRKNRQRLYLYTHISYISYTYPIHITLLVPICRDMQLWWDKPPIPSPRNWMPGETYFDDVDRNCACVAWTPLNVCDSPNKECFPFKSTHYSFFLISLFVNFFRYSFQYRRNSIRPSTQFIHFCRRSTVETIISLGPCTLR